MIDQIRDAAARLRGRAVKTPLLTFPALNDRLGGTLYLKPENLQHTGSFKYRGALNHLVALNERDERRPIIAYSSGNHAQGVAKAATDAGLPATLIMPADAPQTKIARTKAFGGEVVLYDRETESREDRAARLPQANEAYLIPPYDHELTIAGQGTLGLEVVEQLAGAPLDQALLCCGGGGLATGVTAALRSTYPDLDAYAVEPRDFDDFGRSLRLQRRVGNARKSGSICDSILTPRPGHMTFALAQDQGMRALTVSDRQALLAVAYAAQDLRLIVEPGGAVALAAALAGKVTLQGKTTLAVLSGGNLDAGLLATALETPVPSDLGGSV